MDANVILAIDLGRYNSVACWYDPDTRATEFRTVQTTPDELRRVLTQQPVSSVVFEACSQAGWVHDLCEEVGLPMTVASTNGEARQWKSLIGLRKRLVSERVRTQNRIRGVLVGQGLMSPRGFSVWTTAGLNGLATLARPLAECPPDQLWRGELVVLIERYRSLEQQIQITETHLDGIAKQDPRVRLLLSIPGVGPRTAEVIVAHLPDAKRFHSADEVSAYPGLVPRQYQSGETDRRGRITRRGPRLLRAALVE